MCTIAILYDHLADVPVAIAANRDELYDRPAHAPVALGPGRVAALAWADGPPCVTGFVDALPGLA